MRDKALAIKHKALILHAILLVTDPDGLLTLGVPKFIKQRIVVFTPTVRLNDYIQILLGLDTRDLLVLGSNLQVDDSLSQGNLILVREVEAPKQNNENDNRNRNKQVPSNRLPKLKCLNSRVSYLLPVRVRINISSGRGHNLLYLLRVLPHMIVLHVSVDHHQAGSAKQGNGEDNDVGSDQLQELGVADLLLFDEVLVGLLARVTENLF